MPEIESSDVALDPFDPDWIDPPRKGVNQARATERDIESKRAALFDNGSEFKFTTREEIVGIDNVLREIDQVIHWLQNSETYQAYDSRLEPGVIFEGEPGTGKTLVSRYIASASDSLFINVRDFPITGSLFKATDIQDLFRRARAKFAETNKPIVLFWDEFEGSAVERANATAEQAATVSQLTAELDGIHGKNAGVILIGCTNYLYGIDQALRRPGRMGLQIEFAPPDRKGKELLLNHYLGLQRVAGEVDAETLSFFFESDATAAEIEEACVESWRVAVRRAIETGSNQPAITQEDLVEVFLKRLVGPPSSFVNLPRDDLRRISAHEVGHAVMALVYGIPLRLITVQPGKKALGRVITAEVREHIGTIDEMLAQLRVAIGSICAEEECSIPALVGSTGDIRKVNELATRLVDQLYVGERTGLFNPRAVATVRSGRMESADPNVSAEAILDADDDIRLLLDKTYEQATSVMAHIGAENLLRLAEIVCDETTLTGAEFRDHFEAVTGRNPRSYCAE